MSSWLGPYSFLTDVPAIPYKAPNNGSSDWLFHHWSRHNSIVVGPTLYIHGGELNIWNGSGDPAAAVITIPNQYTYGIDLSTSWRIADVELNGTLSTLRSMNSEALWLDATGSAFYVYNGGVSLAELSSQTPSKNELWKFTPSRTTGTWEQILPQADSNFSSLVRITNGCYASGNGLGFALGGDEGTPTIVAIGDRLNGVIGPTPGLVMFNSSSSDRQWYNLSSISLNYPSGVAMSGAAHFVPHFGPEGLLFVIGGYNNKQGAFAQTNQVTIFDPVSQQWAVQATTGEQPEQLQNQCLIGLKGDNGTYEIYMYGGLSVDSDATVAQAKVSVLSIPSFIWQVETSSATPGSGRFFHSCNIVGLRQMMVIGGIITNKSVSQDTISDPEQVIAGNYLDFSQPDPNPQGISIFDLSNFQWKTDYNATAMPYVTPDVIKNEVQAKGPYPSEWSNPLVKSWFNTTPPESRESNSIPVRHHTSAVVGGVVGAAVLLALVILASLYLRAHRRRQHHIPNEEKVISDPKAMGHAPETDRIELSNNGFVEISSLQETRKWELPNNGLIEMNSPIKNHERREMPAHDPSNPIYEI